MAALADVLQQPVVAKFNPPVVTITVRNNETIEEALERSGFSLQAPDSSIEWPVVNDYAKTSQYGIDVNQRIQDLINLATLAPARQASNGMCWLGRIKF